MAYKPSNANGQANMANSEPVVIASDQTAVPVSVAAGTNNIGDVDVLTLPALPAGTNAIGKLAANSGVDIGDVDVTSLPVAFNTGTRSATTQRVTIATDDIVPAAQSGTWTVQPGNTANSTPWLVTPGGNVAHDAVDSGNPLKIGGKTSTTVPTPVASADRTDAWFDEYGRQVVSDSDIELGVTSGTTALRDRLVAQRCTVLSDSLADGIAGFWTQAVANGGTVTTTGGEGLLKTSTATNGSAQIVSTNVAYYPGQVAWMNSAIRFGDTGTAGDIRRLGMFTVSGTTPQEGFYFELSGTTLNAVTVKAGTPTAVASTSWTRFSTAPFTLDTNYHSFEIRYTANSVWFYVDNVLRHSVSGTTTPLTSSLTLPIAATNIKTSGATDITFAIRNIGNGRFGQQGGVVAETGLSAIEAIATGGGTPHDSVDSGNPLKMGAKAIGALSGATLVSAADRTNTYADLDGAQLNRLNGAIGDYVNGNASNTDGSNTQVLAAGAAGVKHYLTDITLSNTSSSNIYVEIKDGTTVKWTFPVPANSGVTHSWNTPIGGTAATAWNFDPSAATTTVYCSVSGFKSKI